MNRFSLSKKIVAGILAVAVIVSTPFALSFSSEDSRSTSQAQTVFMLGDPGTGSEASPTATDSQSSTGLPSQAESASTATVEPSTDPVVTNPPYATEPDPVDPLPTRISTDGKFFPGITIARGLWKSDTMPKNSGYCVVRAWSDYTGSPDADVYSVQMRNGGTIMVGMWSQPSLFQPKIIKLFETYNCGGWTLKRAE